MTLNNVLILCIKYRQNYAHTHTNILTIFSCQGNGFGLKEENEIETMK